MTDAPGTHTLTKKQADGMEKLYGDRYTVVQTGTHGPLMIEAGVGNLLPNNRATRRRLKRAR